VSLHAVLDYVVAGCTVLRKMVIFYPLTSVIAASCLTTPRNVLLQSVLNQLGLLEPGARCNTVTLWAN